MPRPQSRATPQSKPQKSATSGRRPLQRPDIIAHALRLTDAGGVENLSMRKLAQSLGVEAMSLYNHIPNKDGLLDAMLESILAEVYAPLANGAWREEMYARSRSLHDVLLKHPWAAAMMETRGSGPIQLAQHEACLACLRNAGFSVELTHRVILTLDGFLYGFTFQEVTWPYPRHELPGVIARMIPQMPRDLYPHVVEIMHYVASTSTPASSQHRGAYPDEFEFGLQLLLDGMQQALLRGKGSGSAKKKQPRKVEV